MFISEKVANKKNGQKRSIYNLVLKFYSKQGFIASVLLYKALNCSILRSNLSLPNYHLSSKSRPKRASLKRLRRRLSKRLPRLKKKSNSRLKRLTKLKSLTCGYNKSGAWAIWLRLIKSRFRRL
jgi:hypothetical protein